MTHLVAALPQILIKQLSPWVSRARRLPVWTRSIPGAWAGMSQNSDHSKRAPVKLPHAVIVKPPGLRPMLYTMRELAEELGLPERTLRNWLDAGAPYQWDWRRHIWISGNAFREWVQAQREPERAGKLQDSQAYCLRCKTTVELVAPEHKPIKGILVHIKGACPQCGCVIIRGVPNGTTYSSNQRCVGQ